MRYLILPALVPLSGAVLLAGTMALSASPAHQGQGQHQAASEPSSGDTTKRTAGADSFLQSVPVVRYVNPGPGIDTRLNMPDVAGATISNDRGSIASAAPELLASLTDTELSARWADILQLKDGRFSGEARYGDSNGRELVIVVWTPQAAVEWVALKDSPVRRFEQGTVGSWQALIMLPTKDVVGSAQGTSFSQPRTMSFGSTARDSSMTPASWPLSAGLRRRRSNG